MGIGFNGSANGLGRALGENDLFGLAAHEIGAGFAKRLGARKGIPVADGSGLSDRRAGFHGKPEGIFVEAGKERLIRRRLHEFFGKRRLCGTGRSLRRKRRGKCPAYGGPDNLTSLHVHLLSPRCWRVRASSP